MRKGIAFSVAAAALAMTAASVTPAAASENPLAQDPPPTGVTMKLVTVNGSGCPAGTAAVALARDFKSFTVTYSAYIAQTGGASKPIDARKSCQLNLDVFVPHGFSYAVSKTEHRGYASLQPGAKATQVASYYFQGETDTKQISHHLAGPLKDDWQFNDTVPFAQLVWSPCGEQRYFNIKTEVRVDVGTDPAKVSYIGVDSIDNTIKTTYHYSWKKCS
ncbi:DUF4360 domain-containing protein [Actinomadura sp. KC216]|uniref:DUF4360 domain-containing protein n=1 Tax=Actinomadura sp. KC216 TaxID=2530370 RepID=UPI0010490275|nr:DUF4360 domain-containing protein [Actinomadura sp. KC216]TDB90455.1 DUF4360 domain-containing protein [Actinomadura sp. KC216]